MAQPTQAELALALGVDPALVTRYKRRGMPVDSITAAIDWKRENVRARVGTAAGGGVAGRVGGKGAEYEDHRTRREKAEAERAEVRNLREQRLLLMKDGAERAVFDIFRGLRDAVMQACGSAAPKVRGLGEVREIRRILEEEQRQAMHDFDARMERRLAELADQAAQSGQGNR